MTLLMSYTGGSMAGAQYCCWAVETADMTTIKDLLESWLSKYSTRTQESYRETTTKWIEWQRDRAWLMKDRAITHATRADAQLYIKHISERPGYRDEWGECKAASATIIQRHKALKSFYAFLIECGHAPEPNPFGYKLTIQATRKRHYERLSDEDVVKMIRMAEAHSLAHHAVLCALFGGGLRRSEVCGLCVGDIMERAGIGYYRLRRQKNKKLSIKPLPNWASTPLLAYKESRVAKGASDSSPLFVKDGGPRHKQCPVYSTQLINALFKDYAKQVGVKMHVSSHCGRVTAITKLLETGKDYREVQDFSRHSSIQMVEVYDRRRFDGADHPVHDLNFFSNTQKED